GSKRLPRKNLMPLGGRPMLAWTIDAAAASGGFDQVHVSTEDAEIAEVAERHGAVVHHRPEALAQDLSSSADVCLDAADAVVSSGGPHDALICLQPSSPLMTAADVQGAWEAFVARDASFLLSVTPIDPHYFHWALEQRNGEWRPYFGDTFMRDRLELPEVFRPNGAIKIAAVDALRSQGNFFGSPLAVHPMPEERSVHVADSLNVRLADLLLNDRLRGEGS
ncbi:MAG TPA: acylneuraminate cytidylyltransferase family protein, partial [Baekduia sp.]|nr:acylneuraminate cytidylyltransferase family protein [Baekduia sp.]